MRNVASLVLAASAVAARVVDVRDEPLREQRPMIADAAHGTHDSEPVWLADGQTSRAAADDDAAGFASRVTEWLSSFTRHHGEGRGCQRGDCRRDSRDGDCGQDDCSRDRRRCDRKRGRHYGHHRHGHHGGDRDDDNNDNDNDIDNRDNGSGDAGSVDVDAMLENVYRHDRSRHGRHHGYSREKSIYEMLRCNERTSQLARLVEKQPSVRRMLEDDSRSFTLFAPTDDAFDRFDLDEHRHEAHARHSGSDKDDDKDKDNDKDKDDDNDNEDSYVRDLLHHHMVDGERPARQVVLTRTMPTELTEDELGDRPQRLRVSFGWGGVHINFMSHVVDIDIPASNGVIHLVDTVIPPPPRRTRTLALMPSYFSTVTLALERTGLDRRIDSMARHATSLGGTMFVPNNQAWAALGTRLNAFLFGGSRHGEECLAALLKYHVVANHTLYTDAYYAADSGRRRDDRDDRDDKGMETSDAHDRHMRLHTLLCHEESDRKREGNSHDRHDHKPHCDVYVAVKWWLGMGHMTVSTHPDESEGGLGKYFGNMRARVTVQDGPGRDGSIQVVNRVLIPPMRRRSDRESDHQDSGWFGREMMTPAELAERLGVEGVRDDYEADL